MVYWFLWTISFLNENSLNYNPVLSNKYWCILFVHLFKSILHVRDPNFPCQRDELEAQANSDGIVFSDNLYRGLQKISKMDKVSNFVISVPERCSLSDQIGIFHADSVDGWDQ